VYITCIPTTCRGEIFQAHNAEIAHATPTTPTQGAPKKFTFITSDVRACVMFQFKCHVWIVDIRSLFVYDFLGLLSIWLLVVVLFKSLISPSLLGHQI